MAVTKNANGIARTVLTGLAILLLIGVVGSFVMGSRARGDALENAVTQARAITDSSLTLVLRPEDTDAPASRSPRRGADPADAHRGRRPERLRHGDPVVGRRRDPLRHRGRPDRQSARRGTRADPRGPEGQAADQDAGRRALRDAAARVQLRRGTARRRRAHALGLPDRHRGGALAHERHLHRRRPDRGGRPAPVVAPQPGVRACPGPAPGDGTRGTAQPDACPEPGAVHGPARSTGGDGAQPGIKKSPTPAGSPKIAPARRRSGCPSFRSNTATPWRSCRSFIGRPSRSRRAPTPAWRSGRCRPRRALASSRSMRGKPTNGRVRPRTADASWRSGPVCSNGRRSRCRPRTSS